MDYQGHSSSGTCVVLNNLLKLRGSALKEQVRGANQSITSCAVSICHYPLWYNLLCTCTWLHACSRLVSERARNDSHAHFTVHDLLLLPNVESAPVGGTCLI